MLRLPIFKRAIPALQKLAAKNQLIKFWSFKLILQAATPKGFGKFYPNNEKDEDSSNDKKSNQESSDSRNNPFSFTDDFKGFGGGGGGGNGGNRSNRSHVAAIVVSITLSIVLSALYEMNKSGR